MEQVDDDELETWPMLVYIFALLMTSYRTNLETELPSGLAEGEEAISSTITVWVQPNISLNWRQMDELAHEWFEIDNNLKFSPETSEQA